MVKLPVELKLEIARHISNMWHRENYLEALGIDEIYYSKKSRPVPKDFMPMQHFPRFEYFPESTDSVCSLELPIDGGKFYLICFLMGFFDNRTCSLSPRETQVFKGEGGCIVFNRFSRGYYLKYITKEDSRISLTLL